MFVFFRVTVIFHTFPNGELQVGGIIRKVTSEREALPPPSLSFFRQRHQVYFCCFRTFEEASLFAKQVKEKHAHGPVSHGRGCQPEMF